MDSTCFESLLRSLSRVGTRRRAIAVLLGGLAATFGWTETEAGKTG